MQILELHFVAGLKTHGGLMYLGEFVEMLAAQLHRRKINMPFYNERPWHILFYKLKKSADVPPQLQYLKQLRFDWDGPYPKCQELSEFLHALHWNASVSVANPHFETISLPDTIADLWAKRSQDLDKPTREFLEKVADMAGKEFAEAAPTEAGSPQ